MTGQPFTGRTSLTETEQAETRRVAAEIGMDPDAMIREGEFLKFESQALRDAMSQAQEIQQARDVETLSGQRRGGTRQLDAEAGA